jgi:hypothetical protein
MARKTKTKAIPLDPRLYSELVIAGAEGRLPLDHPAWWDPKWGDRGLESVSSTTTLGDGKNSLAGPCGPVKRGCARHEWRCSYTGTEVDRCPCCHRSWALISSCPCATCKGNHTDWHNQQDEVKNKARDKQRARRAAA